MEKSDPSGDIGNTAPRPQKPAVQKVPYRAPSAPSNQCRVWSSARFEELLQDAE
jgi:hypothetical protein